MTTAGIDIAVATVVIRGSNSTTPSALSFSCGLIKWCFSVSHLVQLPYLAGRVEGLVVSNDRAYVRRLCQSDPLPKVVAYSDELAHAVRRWSSALSSQQNRSSMSRTQMISLASLAKWQLVRMIEYRAILVLDLDIDMFLSSRGRPPLHGHQASVLKHTLTTLLNLFIRSNASLVATPDFHSPINTGVMLLKPSRGVYEMGLSTLSNGTFDRLLGFDGVGRPSDALRLSWAAMGAEKTRLLNRTVMSRSNRWEFVAATGDQGLFVYIYLVRQRGLAFEPSSHPTRWLKRGDVTSGRVLQSWRVNHFFGGHKPWRGTARCRDYFTFLDEPSFVKTESSLWGTTCHSLLLAKAVCLRKNMSHEQCSWCRSRHQKSTCAMKPRCPPETGWPVF